MIICPTITVDNPEEYSKYLDILRSFASRIHLDCGDSEFTSRNLYPIENIHLPDELTVDLHAMFKNPIKKLETILSLHPSLVIIHAESENIENFLKQISQTPIKKGVAVLQSTPVSQIIGYLDELDHVLVFSGSLGKWGGNADLRLLNKVKELRSLKPSLEISWDGGVNDSNIKELKSAGVDVVNVGGYISKSENPKEAYLNLERAVST